MRKYALFLAVVCIFLGCKKDGFSPAMVIEQPSTQPEVPDVPTNNFPSSASKEVQLEYLVNEFKSYYKIQNLTDITVIDFKPSTYMNSGSGGTVVGVCEVYSNNTKQIHINSDWWPTTTETPKRILMYHELGHCVFNRNHDSRTMSDGKPNSLMNPILDIVVPYFLNHRNYYLEELSTNSGSEYLGSPITFKTYETGTCTSE